MNSGISPVSVELYFIPVQTRVPLKFGTETLTHVTCARACVTVADKQGKRAQGWGETPLSVSWAWPSSLEYQERNEAMQLFCRMLAEFWAQFDGQGHPIELGCAFVESVLPGLLAELNRQRGDQKESMPWLAALVCLPHHRHPTGRREALRFLLPPRDSGRRRNRMDIACVAQQRIGAGGGPASFSLDICSPLP